MPLPEPVIADMLSRIESWESSGDSKALFLNCYMRMTRNMVAAIGNDQFDDPEWVTRLLRHFANYYFVALSAWENDPSSAPAVWRLAHDAAANPHVTPIQKLLLGVNAHINYDLVLTLDDLLKSEWDVMTDSARASRYADHCRVNRVIGQSIDAVQDEILEPAMPSMSLVDLFMGPLDEFLISKLITRWRETVWQNALSIWSTNDEEKRSGIIRRVEGDTLHTARYICRRQN
jgi:hypothetical protein